MTHTCTLCGTEIEHYHEDFNRLSIDATRSADICNECIRKFLDWQQTRYANLFPTKRAKKFLKPQKRD